MTIADTPNTGSDTLDTIIFKSDQAFKDVHQGFLNLAGVQTDTQFKKKVEDGFRQSGEVLSNKLKAFKEEVRGWELKYMKSSLNGCYWFWIW